MRLGGAERAENLAVKVVASAFGNDIHYPAGGRSILSRKRVLEHRHLLHARQRKIGEYRLPAPTVVAGAAIYFE